MANFKARVKRLESVQPQELDDCLEQLSDEELYALFEHFFNQPEIQDWLADDTNNDPVRLQAIETMKDLSGKNEFISLS